MDRIRRIALALALVAPGLLPARAVASDGRDLLRAARACCCSSCACGPRSSCGCQVRPSMPSRAPDPAAPAAPTFAPTVSSVPHPVDAEAALPTVAQRPLHRPAIEAYKHADRLLDLLGTLLV